MGRERKGGEMYTRVVLRWSAPLMRHRSSSLLPTPLIRSARGDASLRGGAALRTAATGISRSLCTVAQQAATRSQGATTGAVSNGIKWWYAGMSGMAFGIVLLGGVTRLTESGLSMV